MKYFNDNGVIKAFDDDADPIFYQGLDEITESEALSIANPKETKESASERVKQYMRNKRSPLLDAINGIGWRASRSGDDAVADEAIKLSIALLDITDDPDLNSAKTYEEMRAAGVAAYRRIAASASPAFAATFKEFTGA